MQRDIESIEITICDEGCFPYEEPNDKDDEEWNPERERFERPRKVNYKRKCIYHGSFIASILFIGGMFYWTYDVLYNYMDNMSNR
jgi:hypothetical protein